jgi:hypothetical protein
MSNVFIWIYSGEGAWSSWNILRGVQAMKVVESLSYTNVICMTSVTSCCCSCRWGEMMSLNCGHQRAYFSSPRWYISMGSHGGSILTGENIIPRRTICRSTTLSNTNSTWTNLGANPGLRGERPATNFLSHGKADVTCYMIRLWCLWWWPSKVETYLADNNKILFIIE